MLNEKWYQEMLSKEKVVQGNAAAKIKEFCERCREVIGDAEVALEYRWSGSGDSGDTEDCNDAKEWDGDKWVEFPAEHPLQKCKTLDGYAEVEDLVYCLLPGGWEINEGSDGTVTVEVQSGEITVSPRWLEYVDGEQEVY